MSRGSVTHYLYPRQMRMCAGLVQELRENSNMHQVYLRHGTFARIIIISNNILIDSIWKVCQISQSIYHYR